RLVTLDRAVAAGPEHSEAVVLRGDVDPARLHVLHWMVGPAMAERQLEGLEADRPAEELVAEADADDGFLSHQPADVLDDVVECAGVAGAVGEEDEVWVHFQNLVCGG